MSYLELTSEPNGDTDFLLLMHMERAVREYMGQFQGNPYEMEAKGLRIRVDQFSTRAS